MRPPHAIALAFLALLTACGGGNSADSSSGDGLSVFNGWARRAGGNQRDRAKKTAVFPDGSVVVTGYFSSLAAFGEGGPNETLLTSAGDTDIFVARYTADGGLMWARGAGGPLNEEGWDVDVAGDGSCFVTGFFKDGAVFGSGEPTEVELSIVDPMEANVFVAKYAADGALLWVAAPSASSQSQGRGIGGLPDGSCVVTGVFFDALTLGPGEPNETTVANEGVAVFVARFAPDGTLAWAREGATTIAASSKGLDTLDDGSSFVVGTFSGELSLGPGASRPEVAVDGGSSSFFVARYDGNGVPQWIRAGGLDAGYVPGEDVAAIPDGTCVVIGSYGGSPTFGAGEANETQLPEAGATAAYNVFVARYGAGGSLLWARGAGGDGYQVGTAIAVHPDASIWITGEFADSATFGLGEANETTLSASGVHDGFLARLFSDGDLRWAKRVPSAADSLIGLRSAGGVAVRSDRSCLVTGSFMNAIEFGIGSFQETLVSEGSDDAFIARFGPNGEF